MTRDEIIRLMGWPDKADPVSDLLDRVERVVFLAAAAEREACAKLCLEEAPSLDGQLCAAAIRARGGK